MPRTLTVDIPEDLEQVVGKEAVRTGKSREQVVLAWLRERIPIPQRGTVDAIMSSFGAWSMTPEERQRIQQMIDEERHMEDHRD